MIKYFILALFLIFSVQTSNAKDNWSWEIVKTKNDIQLLSSKNAKPMFRFQLGAGGSVSQLHAVYASNQSLLSPSFKGEVTDRIIQWTIWDHRLKNPDEPNQKFERRFNITQGGTFDNIVCPMIEVVLKKNQVDLYSLHANQWSPKNRKQFQSQISALTRYELLDQGVLRIRRYLLLDRVTLKGLNKKYTSTYLESWTPFLRSKNAFQGLAISLDHDGMPNWWYKAGQNIPAYPRIKIESTPGYAVVYNIDSPTTSPAVGVVFGKKQGKNNETVLNSMEWNTGIGVLPGINFTNATEGSFVETSLEIVPRANLSVKMASLLQARADIIPTSNVYHPSDTLDYQLQSIRNQLLKNRSRPGQRTEHLRSLIQSN